MPGDPAAVPDPRSDEGSSSPGPPAAMPRAVPIVALAVLAGLAATGLVLASRNDERDDPVAFVRDFIGVFTAGDCDALADLVVTDGQPSEARSDETVEACRALQRNDPDAGSRLVDVKVVSEDRGRAKVRVRIARGGRNEATRPTYVDLVNVDGEWKVDMGRDGRARDGGIAQGAAAMPPPQTG